METSSSTAPAPRSSARHSRLLDMANEQLRKQGVSVAPVARSMWTTVRRTAHRAKDWLLEKLGPLADIARILGGFLIDFAKGKLTQWLGRRRDKDSRAAHSFATTPNPAPSPAASSATDVSPVEPPPAPPVAEVEAESEAASTPASADPEPIEVTPRDDLIKVTPRVDPIEVTSHDRPIEAAPQEDPIEIAAHADSAGEVAATFTFAKASSEAESAPASGRLTAAKGSSMHRPSVLRTLRTEPRSEDAPRAHASRSMRLCVLRALADARAKPYPRPKD